MKRRAFLGLLGATAVAAVTPFTSARSTPEAVIPVAPEATGWASAADVLRVGDTFTVRGRYAINPSTGQTTNLPQHFIVTAVVSGDDVPHWPYPADRITRADVQAWGTER